MCCRNIAGPARLLANRNPSGFDYWNSYHGSLCLQSNAKNRYKLGQGYFQKNLETSLGRVELKIVDVVDQPYEPGMAASPLNLDEFDANDRLRVDQMVEPIIMGPEGLLRAGTVMLRKDDL